MFPRALAAVAILTAAPASAQRAAPAAPPPAKLSACSITYASEGDLRDVLRERGFGFRGYDALCERLRRDGLMVDFTHSSGVLTERAYGWVIARLMRRATRVQGTLAQSNTSMSRTASTPEAKGLLFDAANAALESVAADLDAHAASVAAEEARLRAAMAAGPARGN